MSLEFGQVNWLAVIVSAVATFLLGGVWYSALFRDAWVKAHGFTEEQAKQMQASMNPAIFFGGMFVCYLVLTVVVAVLFRSFGVGSVMQGLGWGLVLWLAPTAALKMTDHIASGKPAAAFVIDAGFQLVALVVTGAVLGGWR